MIGFLVFVFSTSIAAAIDMFALGLALLLAITTHVMSSAPPRGQGLLCTSAIDCSLNGECDAHTGNCVCDAAWTGATCSQLNFVPLEPEHAVSGVYRPAGSRTSWGGSILRDSDGDGLYHLYVPAGAVTDRCCSFHQSVRAFVAFNQFSVNRSVHGRLHKVATTLTLSLLLCGRRNRENPCVG